VVRFTARRLYPQRKFPAGGWVDPRGGLNDMKKKFLILQGLDLQPLCRPARSQSLYRLCYHLWKIINTIKMSSQLQVNEHHATGMARVTKRNNITPGNLGNPMHNIYYVTVFESTKERTKLMVSDPNTTTTIYSRPKCY
jgi:hypothetical protein